MQENPLPESAVQEAPLQQSALVENSAPENALPKNAIPTNAIPTNNVPDLPPSNVIKQVGTELTPTAVLLNMSPDHYTLQLSGMATKRYVELFKLQSKFPQENLFLYETTYQNKPWFVVLYGDYDSVRSAQLAANNLPEAFKNMSSWVKQWQLVQNELRLNNE